MNEKIIIIGSSGPISHGLARSYGSDAIIVGRGPNAFIPFDLEASDPCKLIELIEQIEPRVAVFLSAITGFAACECDPIRTYCVNVRQTSEVIDRLNNKSIPVILVSSSSVFGKDSTDKYEGSPAHPDSTYGKSKRVLERHVLTSGKPLNAVLRLTKVFDKDLKIVEKWLLSYGKSTPLVARANHYVAPLPVSMVVNKLHYMIEQRTAGIVHLTSDGDISYFDLARSLFPEALVYPESNCGESLVGSGSAILGISRSESTAVSLSKCLALIREDIHGVA